jgi:hypothetical protein
MPELGEVAIDDAGEVCVELSLEGARGKVSEPVAVLGLNQY